MPGKTLENNEMDEKPTDFEGIYEVNKPLIYSFMFWRTKDEMLAQDLTSNVFEKAWRTRQSFTGGSAKAWLFRIARTTLIDHWRKVKDISDDGSILNQIESTETPIEDVLDLQTLVINLQNAVDKLSDEMQLVVKLRFVEGKTVRQIAELLDLSEANVRVIQYRALQKLRKYLQ